MLSDYGADVIKVERAAGGDPGRALRAADGYQYYNQAFNRGCGTDRQTDRQSIQSDASWLSSLLADSPVLQW